MGRMGGFTKAGWEKHQEFKKNAKERLEQDGEAFVLEALTRMSQDVNWPGFSVFAVANREDGIQVITSQGEYTVRIHKVHPR